jgi:hypothetical protein
VGTAGAGEPLWPDLAADEQAALERSAELLHEASRRVEA